MVYKAVQIMRKHILVVVADSGASQLALHEAISSCQRTESKT